MDPCAAAGATGLLAGPGGAFTAAPAVVDEVTVDGTGGAGFSFNNGDWYAQESTNSKPTHSPGP